MAKVERLPSLDIIEGFKGTLDFYLYMGIPCVRSWPKSPGHDRAPSVQQQWPAFTWATKNWNSLSPSVQDAYKRMAASTHMTGRDLFIKLFITSNNTSLGKV